MNNFNEQWRRLATLARQAQADRDLTAPFGFAARVTAQALAAAADPWAPFGRFSVRALLVACLLLGASIVVNIVLPVSPAEDDGLGMIDPVAEILEVF